MTGERLVSALCRHSLAPGRRTPCHPKPTPGAGTNCQILSEDSDLTSPRPSRRPTMPVHGRPPSRRHSLRSRLPQLPNERLRSSSSIGGRSKAGTAPVARRAHMVAVNLTLGSPFVAARLQSLTKCPRCPDEADELYKKAQVSAAPSAPASAGGKPLRGRGPGDGLIALGVTKYTALRA
jgi:hypothetical protein